VAAHGDIELTCPHCGESLPPVKVVTRSSSPPGQSGLTISITPQFDDAWKQNLYDTHPECVRATG
jgi:hypothetical protein